MTGLETGTADCFATPLSGAPCLLELASGRSIALPVERWHRGPSPADELLLRRCTGPTLDIGCGPGRLAAALAERGVITLGIDSSPIAVGLTLRRGGIALHRDVFGHLPGEGRWHHVLLADGNIGIGGDPAALLARVRGLLAPGGTGLVEVDPPGAGCRREPARVRTPSGPGRDWFPWAWLCADSAAGVAEAAGLSVSWSGSQDARWFVEVQKAW